MTGRKKTTGRFDTREDLVEFVCRKYYTTNLNEAQISRYAEISATTVSNILASEEAKQWRKDNQ